MTSIRDDFGAQFGNPNLNGYQQWNRQTWIMIASRGLCLVKFIVCGFCLCTRHMFFLFTGQLIIGKHHPFPINTSLDSFFMKKLVSKYQFFVVKISILQISTSMTSGKLSSVLSMTKAQLAWKLKEWEGDSPNARRCTGGVTRKATKFNEASWPSRIIRIRVVPSFELQIL